MVFRHQQAVACPGPAYELFSYTHNTVVGKFDQKGSKNFPRHQFSK